MVNWQDRGRAAGVHLLTGALVAVIAAVLVLGVWYPHPFRQASGGRELFFLLVSVDVVLGPLSTFAVFDRRKGWPVLRRDLAVIVLLQLGALGYGLWTAAQARPVYLVFEKDRFSTVHAIDVQASALAKAPAGFHSLPWTGPRLLSVRSFRNSQEAQSATFDELSGKPVVARPEFWQGYDTARQQVTRAGKPVAQLLARFPSHTGLIEQAVRESGQPPERLVYLPMVSRKEFWTVLVDRETADPVGYIPLDPY